MNSKKLREQRANVWEQMKAIVEGAEADARDMSGEEAATYDRLEADLDRLANEIDRAERHEGRDAQFSRVDRSGVIAPSAPIDEDPDLDRAFGNFLTVGVTRLSAEDRQIIEDRFVADEAIQNAAGVGTGAAGGYLVPPEFRDKIIEVQKYFGPMIRESELIETTSGANMPWATNDDTGNVGAILGENTQATEQDVTVGQASLDAYMYTSKIVRVSYQLLQDRPNFEAWLTRKLGERIGRILNQHFTTGTGTAQPDGIVTSSTVGVTGSGSFATTGGVSFDNVIDLIESIDPAYGGAEGLKFMMHQSVRKAVRKLKDSQGRYLWEPSRQVGTPDMLEGYPIVLNNDMATLAQSSKSLLFGNIYQAYAVRIVKGLSLIRMTERYADYLQVGFLAFERADGTMQDAKAVSVFQTTPTA
ncbi:MAG: phage major capsid protein [Dermatophilaceae bacterium]|nr:phage major capsid protein [Dermatophilaceae bacterium]